MQCHMPIGYKVEEGRIIICEEARKIVKQIFTEYDCGIAATKIAAGLKEKGIPNGNGKVSWTHVSIGRILENPNYLGNEYYPQIIEKDLFDRVQKRREGVRAELGRANHRPGKDERILFGGAVWCGECGAMCTRIQKRHKYGTNVNWKCKGYLYKKQEKCRDRTITDDQIKRVCVDALPHWELAKKYDLIDFDLGVKITGAGFPVYKGQGAQLQRALINFFLDEARKSGYTEIMPPTVVNAASGYGTGQLPDKEGQMYHCEVDDLYLIPTAEVPVTNIYRDVILDEKQLPIKNCAYTQCFRREAGSYGKDVRGLNRLHEFSKVELVRIDKPEHSKQSHQEMLDHVEGLLQKLELPYRILRLCGGDMSFTAALCFDFEVYSEAQKRWLEVSSVSNFDNYQANRLKCRYRDENKKTQLCHTLNGSALALPRIVAALLENNQTPEGIRIPKALVPYTGFDMIK